MTGRHAAPADGTQNLSDLTEALHELLGHYSYTTPEGVVLTPEVELWTEPETGAAGFSVGIDAQFSNEHGVFPGPERSLSLSARSGKGQKLNTVDLFLVDQDGNLAGGASFGFPHQGNDEG